MRVKPDVIEKIITLCREFFGQDIRLYLFGSRTDNSGKGGDIDLFVDCRTEPPENATHRLAAAIYRNVTTRKVDILIKTPNSVDKSIYHTAMETGILLC